MRERRIAEQLECHIMYCGEPTIDCCIRSIEDQTLLPGRITVIEDVTPLYASINERHKNMRLPFSIKIDADCVLYKDCFDILYRAMIRRGDKCYATSVQTLDPFVGQEGGIHLERTEYVKDLVVPDIIGCDRWIRQVMEKRGYEFYEMHHVMAEHWSDWEWEHIFKKSMRIGQKMLYYRSKRYEWIRNFGKRWLKGKGNAASFIALLGVCYGLLKIDGREKGPDFAEDELGIIRGLISDRVIPDPEKNLWHFMGKRKDKMSKEMKPMRRWKDETRDA